MRRLLIIGLCIVAACAISIASAHQSRPRLAAVASSVRVPDALAVRKTLPAPPRGVSELKFLDLFKLPVGARGLETTDKLRELDGKRVRMIGFMVQQEARAPGVFLLSPLPVVIGDDDEGLADDVPASTVPVTITAAAQAELAHMPGLIQVTGVIKVGAYEIPRLGRVAAVQLMLDPVPSRALLRYSRQVLSQRGAAAHDAH